MQQTMLLPYNKKSKGAKRIAESLGIKCIKRDEGSAFNPNDKERVINWGASLSRVPSHCKGIDDGLWINHPKYVDCSVDKLLTFRALDMANIPTPVWSTNRAVAQEWCDEGHKVVVRFDKRGMQSHDMTYINGGEHVPNAQLYTRFFGHECEVRVHVVNGKVVEIHDKTKAGLNGTHTGLWYEITEKQRAMLSRVAIDTISAIKLDFGAVDILWDSRANVGIVLEINTAPSMENGTLEAYTQAFKSEFNL